MYFCNYLFADLISNPILLKLSLISF